MRISDWSSDVCSSDLASLVTRQIDTQELQLRLIDRQRFLLGVSEERGDRYRTGQAQIQGCGRERHAEDSVLAGRHCGREQYGFADGIDQVERPQQADRQAERRERADRKSTRLNSSH